MKRLIWLVLLVPLAAADVPVVHAHDGMRPGLYNDQCSLERLATAPTAVLPDAGVPAIALGPTPKSPAAVPVVPPSAGPLDPPGARAPPAPDPASA